MNRIYNLIKFMSVMSLMAACTDDLNPDAECDDNQVVRSVSLDVQCEQYGGESRAASAWKDGDVIFLRMTGANGGEVLATVKYNANESVWEFDRGGGLLKADSETTLNVCHIDGGEVSEDGIVRFDYSAVVYRGVGTYLYNSKRKTLTLSATITPYTGRIRFKGTAGENLSINGLVYYTYFDFANNLIGYLPQAIQTKVNDDGYTDYFHCLFFDISNPSMVLGIEDNGENHTHLSFYKSFSTNMLSAGKNGWINIPSAESHAGWEMQETNMIGGYEYADLGLPSGLLWATCNVGSLRPEEYGCYFAWGDTDTKDTYSSDNCVTYNRKTDVLNVLGIVDSNDNLTPEYDAAAANWGSMWRMPTSNELDELIANAKSSVSTINGVKVLEVKSKVNGNSIFLPMAGYKDDKLLLTAGEDIYFWTSTLNPDSNKHAYVLCYSPNSYVKVERHHGLSVRPVANRK